ncbi:MAG: hypothetical protein JWP89_1323 [Schlesneria sp.]|nr:hypothetical protein [Schlesneria sp.]
MTDDSRNWIISVRCSAMVAAALVVIAVIRISATYSIYSQTSDEPYHILRGYLWLTRDKYVHTLHPPLAPIAFAIGPVLFGANIHPTDDKQNDGNAILHSLDYVKVLTRARMGNLLFLFLAAAIVWGWCCEYYGPFCAVVAVFIFTMIPPVLGHSGLATTDMAISATLCMSIWMFVRWLDRCAPQQSIALGIALGLTLLSKFSAVAFLPASCIAVLIAMGWRPHVGVTAVRRAIQIFYICCVTFIIVWIGYRCSIGSILNRSSPVLTGGRVLSQFARFGHSARQLLETPVPAPEFFQGLATLVGKNEQGHASYFLGRTEKGGNLAFFPVALTIKTPAAFLFIFMVSIGVILRWKVPRTGYVPFACFIGVLGIAAISRINIGLRHVLPLYPIFSVCCAIGINEIWMRSIRYNWPVLNRSSPACARVLIVSTILCGTLESVWSHPDYLPFFNVFAGQQPEDILIVSDLDWGQDLDRLVTELKRRSIRRLYICYFGTADLNKHGLPEFEILLPRQKVDGYVAISMRLLKTNAGYDWLEKHPPLARIGKSIVLFHIDSTPSEATFLRSADDSSGIIQMENANPVSALVRKSPKSH